MDQQIADSLHQNVACPFCGLCCDDLSVRNTGNRLTIENNGCVFSKRGFDQLPSPSAGTDRQPKIQGHTCTLDEAIAHSTDLLRISHLPLFGGLGTDVAGSRAVLELADRTGAVLDHMNSTSMLRNLLTVQDSGWMTATLTEVRNRVDVMLIFGGGIERHLPRFFERFFNNSESMFGCDTTQRELIIFDSETNPAPIPHQGPLTRIPCAVDRLGDIAMTMRALLKNKPFQSDRVAGIPIQQIRESLARLEAANYGVVSWVSADLDFPHAELAVQAFSELVKELNARNRCSALPLSGNNGDHTFSQVATWQTGYATRLSLADGHPRYDPLQYGSERLLSQGETDLLLWISAFDTERIPPAADMPCIVLGRAGMQLDITPDVFIPVATPGLDHSGHVYRCDAVAALPLRRLRDTDLPSVARVVHAITYSL